MVKCTGICRHVLLWWIALVQNIEVQIVTGTKRVTAVIESYSDHICHWSGEEIRS